MFTLAHKTRIQFIMIQSGQQGLEALVKKEKTLNVHVSFLLSTPGLLFME